MIVKFGIPLAASVALGFAIGTVSILTPKEQLGAAPFPPPVTTLEGETISGLGECQPPGETVAIATPISGVISEVYAVAGQAIRRGEPLFRLDDRASRAELAALQSSLASAQARLHKLRLGTRPEDLVGAIAKVEAASVNLQRSEDQLSRSEKLRPGTAISEEEFLIRRFTRDQARAELKLAKAELARLEAGTWAPDLAIAEQEVQTAQHQVDRILIDIERLVVRAPVDGIVLHVNLRVGEYAESGRHESALVQLGPAGPLQVRVQFDEEDVSCFRPEAKAEGYLRGRLRKRVPLQFVRIEPRVVPKSSLTGASTERIDTRVMFVVYQVDGDTSGMYSGQKLDVFIENLANRNNALQ